MGRRTKPKPEPLLDKPVMCHRHPRRLATVQRLGIACCWTCYFESVLEIIRGGFKQTMVERRLNWWIKEYDRTPHLRYAQLLAIIVTHRGLFDYNVAGRVFGRWS